MRLDYGVSDEIGLEEAQDLIKEIVTFMEKEIELGDSGIAYRDSDGFDKYYFSRKEDEKRLEQLHLNYMTDETYAYFTQMEWHSRWKEMRRQGMD